MFSTPPGAGIAPRRIQIFLKDGGVVNCVITIPWLQWMQQLFQWHGVLFECGWIPADLIKLIVPLNEGSGNPLPDNVVSLFKGK